MTSLRPARLLSNRAARLGATACALWLAVAPAAHATAPPSVPETLRPDAGSVAFLVGHAVGTQDYVCLPSGLGFAWTLITPQATLFDDKGRQIVTHFASPNPIEGGTIRPSWQHSRDSSSVWVRLVAQSSDPAYVAPGALPWFLLQVVGASDGPTGGDALSATTQIQRVATAGGLAPASGCAQATDVGTRAFVPYAADYFFFRPRTSKP
jgi:hypothetical protein